MTNGGVMMGSTVSVRRSALALNPVRVAISANASPSPVAARGAREGQRERVPRDAAPAGARQAVETPDPRRQEPVDGRADAEHAVTVVDGAQENLCERKEREDADDHGDADHARGDEDVAAERAAQREADAEARDERRGRQRGTDPHPGLGDGERLRDEIDEAAAAEPLQRAPERAAVADPPRGGAEGEERDENGREPTASVHHRLGRGRRCGRAEEEGRAPGDVVGHGVPRQRERAGESEREPRGEDATRKRCRRHFGWLPISRSQRAISRFRSAALPYFTKS